MANIPADHAAVIGRTFGETEKPEAPKNLIQVRCEGDISQPEIVEAERTEAETATIERTDAPEVERVETPKTETTPPVAAPNTENRMEKTPEQILQEERKRSSEITALCRDFKIEGERADEFINKGNTVDEVRTAILEGLRANDPSKGAGGGITVGADRAAENIGQRMVDGMMLRVHNDGREANDMGQIVTMDQKRVNEARDFRGMSMIRMAEHYLTSLGVNTRGMDNVEIAKLALRRGTELVTRTGAVTTDFPSILGEIINKSLRRQYLLAERTYQKFTTRTNATDFKPMTRAALGDAPKLKLVTEGGEITSGQTKDEKEVYAIEAYGRRIGLDWRALVNDDLNAFGRLPIMMANQVAQLQSDVIYAILNDNPNMGDGVALFHSTHGNLAGTAATIDDTSLALAKKAMREQKSMGDALEAGSFLNLQPKFLIVGPAREHAAVKILNYAISPDSTSNVNIWQGSMEVIVDARITDNRWFLAADPGLIDTIEYAFLNGREFWTDMEQDFNTSGWSWKIETAFGAKALDYRGLYKNAGA